MSSVGLAVLSIHQRDAALDVRERAAAAVAALGDRRDVVALSSCHRVELYARVDADGASAGVAALLPALPLDGAAILAGRDAVRHAFRVAAGLDSAVLGEAQIASQLRRAHERARAAGLDPVLDRMCRRALALARELRATTALGRVSRSVGSLAVEDGVARLADPSRATALVVGAGEIGKLAARALAQRVRRVLVANRDAERAQELAARIGGEAIPLDRVADDALAHADLLISAADTRGALLTRDVLARRCAARPLVVLDIAVPRSVAPDARTLAGIVYSDVDHLAARHVALPADDLAHAERRCAEEADAFMADLRARNAGPLIGALHARAAAIRRRELARAMRKLGHLDERDRRVVEALASTLTGALLHAPTVALRDGPEHRDAASALFGLEAER